MSPAGYKNKVTVSQDDQNLIPQNIKKKRKSQGNCDESYMK